MNPDGLELIGLDGGNPLAFLAALGTLRASTAALPSHVVRMSWRRASCWRPVLHIDPAISQDELVTALDGALRGFHDHATWSLGSDLTVTPERFREYAAGAARACTTPERNRTWADFAAAFGCEATVTDRDTIQDTALRTMSGAGHQHFLEFMRIIIARTEPRHIEKTLFHPWRYDDPQEKQTLRWDPADDARRALRWRDPSGDPARKKKGAMLGANRLAIEGLPVLASVPTLKGFRIVLRTTGFLPSKGGQATWTWPIWTGRLSIDVVRSVLTMGEMVEGVQTPERLNSLLARGVAAVYQSRRLTEGKFRCFTPAELL